MKPRARMIEENDTMTVFLTALAAIVVAFNVWALITEPLLPRVRRDKPSHG